VSGSGNYGVACVFSDTDYSCTIPDIAHADTWTGSISVSTNKVVCEGTPTVYTGVSEDQEQHYTLEKLAVDC